MLDSIRIGTVATLFAVALTSAAYAAGPSTAMTTYSSAQMSQSKTVAIPTTDDEAEPILPRAYRSKCDDLTDLGQQQHCFRAEQDEQVKAEEGQSR